MSAAITIHFRNSKLTAGCIDSLLADGWAPILVWDNSADQGVTLSLLEERYIYNKHVMLVNNPKNLGFGKGMNAALAELGSRGYSGPVLLVNNDVRVVKGMHTALHAPLKTENIPTMVAPRILQNGQEQGWLYYQPWFALVTARPLIGSFAYLSGCCLLIQRSNNTEPLYDEDFFMYGEDVELSWRWNRKGGRLVLLESAWLQHEGSASSGQASEAYERFLVSSHWLLADKLATNNLSFILFYALRIPSLIVRACLRAIRYRSMVPLYVLVQIRKRSTRSAINHEVRR